MSCIVAESLAEPPEACRSQEGLKSRSAQPPRDIGKSIRRAPTGRPSFPTQNPGEVFQASEGDEGATVRSSDLTKAATNLEKGLAT
jgi:hypothetical protein